MPTPPPWPILPRPEADELRDALAAGRSVVVVGDVGVGKSELVAGAIATLDRPVVTVSGRAVAPGLTLDQLHPALAASLLDLHTQDAAPLLLRVEDAHLLDRASAHALCALVHHGRATMVATLRTAAASRSPWLELWKDGAAERIDVPAFSPRQVERLLEAALGGPLTTDTCLRIVARTQGNAFHLRELVRSELAAGTLVETQGTWVGVTGVPPGPRVLDVLRAELDRLDPAVREGLELIALADELPVRYLASLVSEGVLDDLVREGLVVTDGLDSATGLLARVSHPMYGEAIRQLVPPGRRRRLYARVRAVLPLSGATTGTPLGTLRMVTWALESGVRETPARVLAAMRVALDTQRWQSAVWVGSAALEFVAPDDPQRADVLLMRGEAWRHLDRPAEANEDLTAVAALLAGPTRTPLPPSVRLRLSQQLAYLHQFHSDDVDQAVADLEEARRHLAGTAPEHVRVLEIDRLTHLGHAGRFGECLEASLELLRTTDPTDVAVLRLANPVVLGLALTGRLEEAVRVGTVFAQRSVTYPDPERPWLSEDIAVALGMALAWVGDVEGLARLVGAQDQGGDFSMREALAQTARGVLASCRGQWSDAHRDLAMAAARYSIRDTVGTSGYILAAAAVAAAAAGDLRAARASMTRALAVPLRISASVEPEVRLLLLDAAAWVGERPVRPDALELASWCAERGLARAELEALHRAVVAEPDTPPPPGALDRLVELGEVVSGPRPAALVAHARAVAAGDRDLAEVAVRRLGEAGLWLPTGSVRVVLTRREREIASLAAGGLSSKAIAERFTLSVRTVDSHLSRVFTKLGVRSRRELAGALRD